MKKKKVYLTLQTGEVFQGYRFGAEGEVSGELVFSTGMVGYMETLTDPANYGQIVVQTFPLIGNYGIMRSDVESEKTWVSAYVVREACENPSNFRMEGSLGEYLKENGVVGIYGVDTRQITKIIREKGAMKAWVSNKPFTCAFSEAVIGNETAVEAVAPKTSEVFGAENAQYTIALWNFGEKKSRIESLVKQGYRVISMPASATAEEILALNVDGVVISEGPGNPKENKEAIQEISKLLGKKPVLGIGLGHQLIALATGADTAKMKYGHRGSNQPVKCVECGRVYISTQNHSYEVVSDTVKKGTVNYINVNDGSCEGIDYEEYKALSVQFSPESCSASGGSNPVYEKFFTLIKKEKENA